MRSLTRTRSTTAPGKIFSTLLVAALLFVSIPFTVQPAAVEAAGSTIKWPFVAGSTWYISQGYNTSPNEGWSHYNCDPSTLKDSISQSRSCNQYYQYKYSFDLKKLDGNTAGQNVVSPVNGTIRWIDEAYGGMSINLGNGYAVAYFHTNLAAGLAAGQTVTQGQLLGTIAPAGQAGNSGTAHIHFTLWQTTDGGNWSRNAIPFTDEFGVDGYDLPGLGDASKNQHYQQQIVSSNQVTSAGTATAPGVPQLSSPATGTTYTTTGPTPALTWAAVSGATEYQVVVNDGSMTSPWVSTTSWKMPALANGQYAWQVRAKNTAGTSNLSAKWVFWVDPVNGGTTTPTATVTGTPGALGLTLNKTSTTVNADVQASGTGFNANETVNLYLDSTSSTPITSVKAASNGTFTKLFAVPEAKGGSHSIIAKGASSAKQTTKSISVSPTLTRTPYQGVPGTSIAVTVYGFGASETVRLDFFSTTTVLLGNITTNAKGTGTLNITMPDATNGWHDYSGTGLTSSLKGWGALYVERLVKLSPTSGTTGTSVTVTVKGFTGGEAITVGWNRTATISGTTVCTGTLSSNGNYSCSFSVPQSVSGAYPVTASTGSGATTTANFIVAGPAGISINPTSGAVSSNITINGGGFTPNEQVRLNWDSAATWVTVQTDASGTFLWNATVPNLSQGGHTLKSNGVSSNKSANTSFSVTASGGSTGSSMIGPGTFRVTATIEGLVGHTTSNGHLITPFDHFVALPACTQSSCPWVTPGSSSTYVAECAPNCYVRVTNPANGKCSVAPVWDVGPWFTNDNWWDPANKRVLNTRTGAVNQLAQGYTGADAAKNGLDVGYGLSNGIGISNVGYQTGNRAAIDIADGTWVDIGFAQAAGIGTVEVTFLWLTGQSRASAEAGCGQGSSSASISLNASSGEAGTSVKVSGTGFAAQETVEIYVGATTGTPLITTKSDESGKIGKTIVIPNKPAGTHDITAKGRTSGKSDTATFTITVPNSVVAITLSSTSGPVGKSVKVSGTGFAAQETVEIYVGATTGTPLITTKSDESGKIGKTIVIPNKPAGAHDITAKGRTSGKSDTATFTITVAKPVIAINLSSTSGPVGKAVKVTGTGYGASETVKIYIDSTSRGFIISTKTNSSGGFAKTITIPNVSTGVHKIIADGQTTKLRRTANFTVTAPPKPTLSSTAPAQGPGGSSLRITGRDFLPGETVKLFIDSSNSTPVATAVASNSGTITAEVIIPDLVGGKHLVLAVGQTSKNKTSLAFMLTPTISLSPSSGQNRIFVTVNAKGFAANETVEFFWDGLSTVEGSGQASSSGVATFTVRAPWTNGAHTGAARGTTSDLEETVSFTVVANIKLTPDSGDILTDVTVRGTGFAPGTPVNIHWSSVSSQNVLCTTRSSNDLGTFTCKVSAPDSAAPGEYSIVAVGGNVTATAPFTLVAHVAKAEATERSEPETPTPVPAKESTATPDATVESTPSPAEAAEPEEAMGGDASPDVSEVETVEPTEEATQEATEEPAPEPTATPEPVEREIVLNPIADTSVSNLTPDQPQSAESLGTLAAGGENGDLTLITFQVDGIAVGTVVRATLILTGAGETAAAGGELLLLPGYLVDEAGVTHSGVSLVDAPYALQSDGSVSTAEWIEPWTEIEIDVTGSVAADGFVTFAIPGRAEASIVVGSRESDAPPRLVIVVLE